MTEQNKKQKSTASFALTRWAKTIDPFTLMKLAGHADLSTTMRYVHLNDDDVRAAMKKSDQAKNGHKIGHSEENERKAADSNTRLIS